MRLTILRLTVKKVLISTRTLRNGSEFQFDALERGFFKMFRNWDITAMHNKANQNFIELAATHDLLVLSGGDDHPQRLLTEIEALKQFRMREKPVLGICHGAFLLSQLWGGKLIDVEGHRRTEHTVNYKGKELTVNSYHGSSITEAPDGAKVLVTDQDGYIESWLLENTLAVVWHPERDLDNDHWMPDEYKLLIGEQ